MKLTLALALTVMCVATSGCASPPSADEVDGWACYGHDAGGMRYSPLTRITRSNVSQLRVAWTGHATPMTYKLTATGKQYVVVASGVSLTVTAAA